MLLSWNVLCIAAAGSNGIEKENKRIHRKNNKRQLELSQESVFTHRYMIVVTSLPEEISEKEVLDLYRLRWQVELVFKRLKSIMGIGNLPAKSEMGIRSWLNGKIMVAMLLEKELGELNCFPWWSANVHRTMYIQRIYKVLSSGKKKKKTGTAIIWFLFKLVHMGQRRTIDCWKALPFQPSIVYFFF